MPGEGFNCEVHILFNFGWILQRIGTRDPHAFIQCQADAVSELLQRDRLIFVVVVLGKGSSHVGRGIARAQLFQARVHGVVDLTVQADLLLIHLSRTLEAADKIYEVTGWAHRIDIHDHQVTLTDDLLCCPAAIRASIAPGSRALICSLSRNKKSWRRGSNFTRYFQSTPVLLYTRRGSHSCGLPMK